MKRLNLLLAATAMAICAAPVLAAPATIEKAVADPGRPAADTARDAGRKPAEVVAWAGIKPGMTVVDLLPGGGYFTRIFAKAWATRAMSYAYFGTQYDARLKGQGKDPDRQFMDLKAAYKNLGVIHGPLPQFVTPRAGRSGMDLRQLSRHAQQGLCDGRERSEQGDLQVAQAGRLLYRD